MFPEEGLLLRRLQARMWVLDRGSVQAVESQPRACVRVLLARTRPAGASVPGDTGQRLETFLLAQLWGGVLLASSRWRLGMC